MSPSTRYAVLYRDDWGRAKALPREATSATLLGALEVAARGQYYSPYTQAGGAHLYTFCGRRLAAQFDLQATHRVIAFVLDQAEAAAREELGLRDSETGGTGANLLPLRPPEFPHDNHTPSTSALLQMDLPGAAIDYVNEIAGAVAFAGMRWAHPGQPGWEARWDRSMEHSTVLIGTTVERNFAAMTAADFQTEQESRT